MPSETLLLWKLPTADSSEADQVLCTQVRPALAAPQVTALLTDYYASRRADAPDRSDLRVELTVFAATEQRASLMQALNEVLSVSGAGGPPGDDILAQDLAWFRRQLSNVTDIALELLNGPAADAFQAILERIGDPYDPRVKWSGADYRNLLESHLIQGSTCFTALGPQARVDFWIRVPQWPRPPGDPSYLSPSGHWLWNILNVG